MVNQTPFPNSISQEEWNSFSNATKKQINQLHGDQLHLNSFLPSRKGTDLLNDLACVARAGFCQARLIEENEAMDSQGMIPFLSFFQRYSDLLIGLAK